MTGRFLSPISCPHHQPPSHGSVNRHLPVEPSSSCVSFRRCRRLPSRRRSHNGSGRRGRRCSCRRSALEVRRGDLLVVAINESIGEEAGDNKSEGGVAAIDRASGDGAQLRGVLSGSHGRSFAS